MGFFSNFFKKTSDDEILFSGKNKHIQFLFSKIEKLEEKLEKLQAEKLDYELMIINLKNELLSLKKDKEELQQRLIQRDKISSFSSPEPYDEDHIFTPFNEKEEPLYSDENSPSQENNEIDGVILDKNNLAFIDAFDSINNSNDSLFLTGKAGTGKTTFLKYLTSQLKKKFIVLAPTGMSAVNAGGVTLHSFFNLVLVLIYLMIQD